MRYALILLALSGCAPTVVAQTPAAPMDHSQHTMHGDGHIAGHEAPSIESVAARTSQRIEIFKSAELQYLGASMAYESLPRLDAAYLESRAFDALENFRAKTDASKTSPAEFLAAHYYYNYSIKELLDYVAEQKASAAK